MTGSFRNANYATGSNTTLHLYGALAQDTRGPVGCIDWRGRVKGFTKDYKYDTRYWIEPPPHYEMLSYDFSQWRMD